MKRAIEKYNTIIIILLLSFFTPQAFTSQDTLIIIPDVNITIIRLDFLTLTIKGYYEFNQPYRKSLPEEEFNSSGNVFYLKKPAGDFGYTKIICSLTGQLIFHASTVWAGHGGLVYPDPSEFSSSYSKGWTCDEPDTIIHLSFFGSTQDDADSVWSIVEDTGIINRISKIGNYEVVIFDHFYQVGLSNPWTAEWIVIAFTHPEAPVDLGFIGAVWPRTLITRTVKNVPEIEIHNFSDTTFVLMTQLTIEQADSTIYSSTRQSDSLPADSSQTILFDTLQVAGEDKLLMRFQILNGLGHSWLDDYPENDVWWQEVHVTVQPVFRPISSIRHPGSVPVYGIALDFDGDGDIDVFEYGISPKLWQNDGIGQYIDITHRSDTAFPMNPRLAIAEDFSGDSNPDLLVINFKDPPLYLLGNGEGDFIDYTAESGLSELTAYFDANVLDLENDGDLDIIFQSYWQECICQNDGSGRFVNITSSCGIVDPGQSEGISSADLNNDGYKDVVITNWGDPPRMFINNHDNTFSFFEGPWDFEYGRMSVLFDCDNDGDTDILFSRGHSYDESLIYRNTGDLQFGDANDFNDRLVPSFHADAADINGDGYPELVLDHLDNLTLLINHGGTFENESMLLVDVQQEFVWGALGTSPKAQFVDLDNDGDIDIYSQQIVFENQGLDPQWFSQVIHNSNNNITFNLYQNYPNPFNTLTTITYYLPVNLRVNLVVYNILGEQIRTLVDQTQSQGQHRVVWDGLDDRGLQLDSGVYLYRLYYGDNSCAMKMLLLK